MDSERNIEDARSLCRDLEAILSQENGDSPTETLEEVKRLCEIGKLVTDDLYCQRELSDIERYASQLLSGDVRRWARGSVPDEVLLRQLIFDLLKMVDKRLEIRALRWHSRKARLRAGSARRRALEASSRAGARARG